ncbi:MAG: efflux RND transporter periplasmic adaptor subunit [Hyphomicrobiales bacterium]|nr:efflux RND transporter periplasmic adaptor subunit [Hyphomicrobiales bacterium]
MPHNDNSLEGPAIMTGTRRGLFRRILVATTVLISIATITAFIAVSVATIRTIAAGEPVPGIQPPVAVEVTPVMITDSFSTMRRYVGRLEPARTTDVSFEVGGLVQSVLVDEGETVASGQTIARLDIAKLKSTRRQLEAQITEFAARRGLAQLTLDRQSKLNRQGFASQESLDEARTSFAVNSAAIERINAEIEVLDLDIEKSDLKAPFAGVVAARSLDEGAVVSPGSPILTILETANRQVRIGLPPDVAMKLNVNEVYELTTARGILGATVAAKRPDLQTSTRTVTVLFDIEDGPASPFGDIASLAIEQTVEMRGAWVPLAALKEGRRGLWTIMLASDGEGETVAKTASVEVLQIDGERAYVRGTLKTGDRLISSGTHRVIAGQRISALMDARK